MDLLKLTLERRGLDWAKYIEMSNPDHADLLDIDKMADNLDEIYHNKEKIVILPDFDMDGVMSGVVLHAGLSELGFNSELFIPSSSQGYGFGPKDIDNLIQRHDGVKAIITCDVGVSAFDGVSYAKEKGLKVLVTDHHVPQSGHLVADSVVNPNRVDDTYSNKTICGAHVAWQVLDYYVRHKRNDWMLIQNIEHLRVFAGIGTVSDMMTLVHENRQLVNDSVTISRLLLGYDYETGVVSIDAPVVPQFFRNLEANSTVYKNAFYGLSRLYYTYAKQDKPRIVTKRDITSIFYGFYVAPVFNSLKRLGGDMWHAFGVFFDEPLKQQKHIDILFETNDKRKELVEQYMETLDKEFKDGHQPLAPYVYTTDAPAGIVGLIATRLINKSGVPTLVLSGNDMDGYHGSGRSPEWYAFNSNTVHYNLEILASKYKMTVDEAIQLLTDANLIETDDMTEEELDEVRRRKAHAESHLLVKYSRSKRAEQYFVAGHEGAFGFGAKNYKHLVKFKKHLDKHTKKIWLDYISKFGKPKAKEDFVISLLNDGDLGLDIGMIYQFMRDVHYIEPFGAGWAEPIVKLRFKGSDVSTYTVGADGTHVRFVFDDNDGFVAMVWSAADKVEDLNSDDIVEITGNLSWNYFNERWSVNLICNEIEVKS